MAEKSTIWSLLKMKEKTFLPFSTPSGCPSGYFGKDCAQHCSCGEDGQCHLATGRCNCGPGRIGQSCQQGSYVLLLTHKKTHNFVWSTLLSMMLPLTLKVRWNRNVDYVFSQRTNRHVACVKCFLIGGSFGVSICSFLLRYFGFAQF